MRFVFTKRRSALAIVLLALVLQPRQGFSLVVQIDGYASLNVVLDSESTLVCSTTVSGDSQDGLFGLDTRTGQVKWRTQSSQVLSEGVLVSSNIFLLITKDFLEKRALATGKLIWSTRLDVIPEQKTEPRKKLKDYADEFLQKVGLLSGSTTTRIRMPRMGTPNRYRYDAPILTGSRILVGREANSGTGCIVHRCFEDWLLFDADSGKLIRGGSGQILGRTRNSTVAGDDIGLFNITGGKVREVMELQAPARTYWSPVHDRVTSGQMSMENWCAFAIHSAIGYELVNFDGRTSKARTMVAPATRTNHQNGWVLLDGQVLRYPECPRLELDAAQRDTLVWFELYDWDGRCLRNVETPARTKKDFWWMRYIARTNDGVVFDLDGRRFTVAVPSLAISELPAPEASGTDRTSVIGRGRLSRSEAIYYQCAGNTNIYKMLLDALPYDLTVIARDSATGNHLWQHIERVTIKNIGGSPFLDSPGN